MYSQDRTPFRQVFCEAYSKWQNRLPLDALGQQLVEIIKMHPEYHALLANAQSAMRKEFSPGAGQPNPFLHMAMHLSVREQAGTNRPAGIHAIYKRLVKRLGVMEGEHWMMECLGPTLWAMQNSNGALDESAYLECLRKLL